MSLVIRGKILKAGLEVLAREGYSATTMSRIAQASGCSLDEVYQHFPSKVDLVLHFYHRLAVRLEERLPDLTEGTLAQRFGQVMDWKIKLLEPHRELIQALFHEMSRDQEIGVFSPVTETIRVRVSGVFASVVYGASDVSDSPSELIRLLYRLHLGLSWVWAKEPRVYSGLLQAARSLLALSSPLLPYQPVQLALKSADSLSAVLAAPHDLQWDAVGEKILRRVFLRRRSLNPKSACAGQPCEHCLAPHLAKIQGFLDRNEPIHFVLPAFPAKSPNPEKTVGRLPDLGEQLALRTLQTMCEEISDLYPPGARVTICSDGHVFSDLVEVKDEEVTRYHLAVGELIREQDHHSLELFALSDLHGQDPDYPALREELMQEYGESLETLKARTQQFPHHRSLLDGIHRFMFEDRVVLHPELSRNQARKQARPLAYDVVRRSNAWSRLVAEQFPRAVRLSIHPQPDHSEKIGFLLTRAVDNWITPWHGAILLEDDEFLLLKRVQAEESGAVLVESEGRPSHFVARGAANTSQSTSQKA